MSHLSIDLNNLDKSDWKTYRFDEIAKNISERVDPNNTDLTVYIGLEHLDSGSIHIKRHGSPDDVNGQKLKFYKGDVIFGRRRAYQRKAGIATTDGFCSAHALVLRANPGVILPELFPFFLHSDLFMDRAVDISVGSLSPTINWGTLKHQEFSVPPKELQYEILELLLSAEALSNTSLRVSEKLISVYQAKIDEYFSKPYDDWIFMELTAVAKVNKSSLKAKTDPEFRFKYLDIASILEPNIIGELEELTFSDAPSRARRVVSKDSIVLSLVRPYQRSFVYVNDADGIIASTGTGVIDVDKGYDSRFIYHQFFSNRFLRFCENRMTGTNYPAITPKDVESYKVSVPNNKQSMREVSGKLDSILSTYEKSKESLAEVLEMKNSIINQVF